MSNKISVIIACYNQGQFLNEAVDSIFAQTYTNWECIIINDGSTDNTDEIAKKLMVKDNRISYKKQFNKGVSGARNAGLEICKGDYIQLLDADDALHPKKFERHLEAINEKDFDKEDLIVSYSGCSYSYHNDIYKISPTQINCHLLSSKPLRDIIINWENKITIPLHSYFFSANVFLKKGIRFDEKITICEDFDCWIRIFQMNPKVIFLNEKLAYYRDTPGSRSGNTAKVWKGHIQVLEKHMALSGKGTELYKWARLKKNEVLFRYKKIGRMDWFYMLYFSKGILTYYRRRLFTKLYLKKLK